MCLSCEDTARQSCAMVRRWWMFGDFWVGQISNLRRLRLGEEKRKKIEQTTGQNIMPGSATQGGHNNTFTEVLRSACLYVCRSVCRVAYLEITWTNFTIFSVHVTRGRISVVLWRQCNMLCTPGFVDDVMFSHYGPNADACLKSEA